eukprot:11182915-Karenia_brevis.AAC.1
MLPKELQEEILKMGSGDKKLEYGGCKDYVDVLGVDQDGNEEQEEYQGEGDWWDWSVNAITNPNNPG